MRHAWMRAACAALWVAALPAMATDIVKTKKKPAEQDARHSRVDYRSAFEGYRPYTDLEIGSWREANDAAAALGGHAGQLRAGSPSVNTGSAPTAPMMHQHGAKERK